MNLFEAVLKFNGFPIAKAKEQLKAIQQIPENDYQNYILKAREEIVQYHLNNTSFYKDFIGTHDLTWENIPIMTKSHLQRPLNERLSKSFTKKSVYINKTSC